MPEPFNPNDPRDALADMFRQQVTDMMIRAPQHPAFAAVENPIRQVECFMGGVLVGLIGVCFSHVQPEARPAMMKAIAEYLPQARQQAEAIVDQVIAR